MSDTKCCENPDCSADITFRKAGTRFCSVKCHRKVRGDRHVSVTGAMYAALRAEADRRGCSVPALVEEALRPILEGH